MRPYILYFILLICLPLNKSSHAIIGLATPIYGAVLTIVTLIGAFGGGLKATEKKENTSIKKVAIGIAGGAAISAAGCLLGGFLGRWSGDEGSVAGGTLGSAIMYYVFST